MARQIARRCDMGEGFKLKLLLQDDGDVIVSVLPEKGLVAFDSVEICASGTQSRRTHKALHQLYKAMVEDENERPQDL
jgi:hypothetical protein